MQSALEIIHAPPPASTFIPLADHQSQTPASFYDAPPVLYYHAAHCKLLASKRDLKRFSLFKGDTEESQDVVLDDVDIHVTSKKLYIYFTTLSSGVAIPYPAISLHAIQKIRLPDAPETDALVQGLYMQLILSTGDDNNEGNGNQDDEDEDMYDGGESITMTIIPPTPQSLPPPSAEAKPDTEQTAEEKEKTPTQSLYAALSACSDLHPDPTPNNNDGDEDDEGQQGDGVPNFPIYNMPPSSALADSHLYRAGLVQEGAAVGLPPPMPGSGGWITAENAHEFFDEEGNWKGRGGEGELGPGAGVKREGEAEVEEDEETKWRKTGE